MFLCELIVHFIGSEGESRLAKFICFGAFISANRCDQPIYFPSILFYRLKSYELLLLRFLRAIDNPYSSDALFDAELRKQTSGDDRSVYECVYVTFFSYVVRARDIMYASGHSAAYARYPHGLQSRLSSSYFVEEPEFAPSHSADSSHYSLYNKRNLIEL